MINAHTKVVNAAQKVGLPVYYELFLDSKSETPCISYMEITNTIETQTDITDISSILYQVKVWGNSIAEIQTNALLLDAEMRKEGFKRVSAQELHDVNSSMIQKVFTYELKTAETIL